MSFQIKQVASAEETAAILGAIESFAADDRTEATPASELVTDPWRRAAILEGVSGGQPLAPADYQNPWLCQG